MPRNKTKTMIINSFYCSECGNRGIELPRTKGHQHKNMHSKHLYCIYCKQITEHIECKDEEDIFIFKENFRKEHEHG